VHGECEDGDHGGAARRVRHEADGDHRDRGARPASGAQPHRPQARTPNNWSTTARECGSRCHVEGLRGASPMATASRKQQTSTTQSRAYGGAARAARRRGRVRRPRRTAAAIGAPRTPAVPRVRHSHGRQIYAAPGPVTHPARDGDQSRASRLSADCLAPRPMIVGEPRGEGRAVVQLVVRLSSRVDQVERDVVVRGVVVLLGLLTVDDAAGSARGRAGRLDRVLVVVARRLRGQDSFLFRKTTPSCE